MNILLTGASGLLGRRIYRQLINEGHTIVTLGRDQTNDFVCDLSKVVPDLKKGLFDGVIHCAGKAHLVPKTKIQRQEFFDVNVKGTQNLLMGIRRVRFFCFISSVSVYGLEKGEGIKESIELKAIDPYGLSKIEGENIVFEWCKENEVLCTILRLPLLIDKLAPGNFGAMLRGIKKGLYYNIGSGEAKKSMVLATDVAKHILRASEVGGVYNLTDGYHPSFKELSHFIANKLNVSPPKNIPRFISTILGFWGDLLGSRSPINSKKVSKMVMDLTFDDTLARKNFGWNPEKVLQSDFLKD